MRLAPSVAVFKKKLLSIIRPPAKSVFGIHDPKIAGFLAAKVGADVNAIAETIAANPVPTLKSVVDLII